MRDDRRIVLATAFLRAVATGLIGVTLGIRLERLRLDPAAVGLVVASGLAGAALAALLATLGADRHGRRRTLAELSLLSAFGAAVAASSSDSLVVGIAAFVGMLNGMGRDRGAALIVEQAILPATVPERGRTGLIAWYNVLQDSGHAIGSLLAGAPALLLPGRSDGPVDGRPGFWLYALLILACAALYGRLSPAVEAGAKARGFALSPQSRGVVARISSLFALDSLAGGLLTTTMLAFWFFERFGAGPAAVSMLFFGARVLNALSHLAAARLAARIGLVNTMVFTHIPSSLLLVTVAFAPSFPVAAALFLLREGLVEMDVPTRQSYVLAIVRPEERTAASGVTNLVRLAAWAVAPSLAGWLMGGVSLGTPLVLGAGMKIAYDVLLYLGFRRLRPPEERP